MVILSDFDDVLENLCVTWVAALNNTYGTKVEYSDVTDWEIEKFFPSITRSQIFSPLSSEMFWKKVEPTEGAVKYTKKLMGEGHDFYIVTASPPLTIEYKYKHVFRKYFPFIPKENFILINSKQLLKGDVFIDDKPDNLIQSEVPIRILMSCPHNSSFDAKRHNIIRVDNWKEIYDLIKRENTYEG